ncbi:MAG: hypothetical protein AAGE59_16260 [Cyanobacteria bacterium P01_F01_bin.86]
MMTTQLGWHYRIRLKRDTWIWRVGKGWLQLKDFRLQHGEALYVHTVKLHKGKWFGRFMLLAVSYFRIGWDLVKTALSSGWQLIQQIGFNGHRDPQPTMASRKQHRKRIYQIEFTVRTYCYPAD